MSHLTAHDIDKKLGAKQLFKFMRRGCNQTVTREQERDKFKLCERAAGLGLTESDVDDWLEDEDTQIAQFRGNQQPQQESQDDQDDMSEDEAENDASDSDGDQDENDEDLDDMDVGLSDISDDNPFAVLQNYDQNEDADPNNINDSLVPQSHFYTDLNQVAGPSSPSISAIANPPTGHLTVGQIRLIREAENIWHDRRLQMMAAGIQDTFENWIEEDSYIELGQLRTDAVTTNVDEFIALTMGWRS